MSKIQFIISRQFSTSKCSHRSFNLRKKRRPPKQIFDPQPAWEVTAGVKGVERNNRDIPILYLPHTTQEAWRTNMSPNSLPRAFSKYTWLYKTLPTNQLPDGYLETDDQLSDQMKQTYADIFTQAGCQRFPEFDRKKLHHDQTASFVSGLLRATMLASDADHMKAGNSYLYNTPRVETHWIRNYQFYNTEFKPEFVLKTKDRLDRVEDTPALTIDQIELLPGPFTPQQMQLFKHGLKQQTLMNRPGSENSRLSPHQHAHTTISVSAFCETDTHLYTQGLSTCFLQAVAQAQNWGHLFGTELRDNKSITTQCIVTNGKKVAFCVFQLNTLLLMDDKGLWNRIWLSDCYDLYDTASPAADQPANLRLYADNNTAQERALEEEESTHTSTESASTTGLEVEGLNMEALNLFNVFLNKSTIS